jgi:hypothetical protein
MSDSSVALLPQNDRVNCFEAFTHVILSEGEILIVILSEGEILIVILSEAKNLLDPSLHFVSFRMTYGCQMKQEPRLSNSWLNESLLCIILTASANNWVTDTTFTLGCSNTF